MTSTTAPVADYSAVLARFANVVPRGDGKWKATCPAHIDCRPSLAFEIGKKGNLLLRCGAGCDKTGILRAVGLTWSDLFPAGSHQQRRGEFPQAPRRIVATYDYRDEAGHLLYQTVRYEPKDFRQRRPDGRGGWVFNLDGVRRVLYRLPELLATDGPVFIVEGEKDADAIWKLGLTATTRAMGAKAEWLASYSISIGCRDVIIIPDEDKAGHDGAIMVAGGLLADGWARSIQLLNLPGLDEYGDASDWIAAQQAVRPDEIRHRLLDLVDDRPYRRCQTKSPIPGTANAGYKPSRSHP